MKCAYCKTELAPESAVPGPRPRLKSKKQPFFCDEDCQNLWERETRETTAKDVTTFSWLVRSGKEAERIDAKYHGRGYEGGIMEGRAPNDRPEKDWDPNTIILKTKAIDNHGYEYHVSLERSTTYFPGEWVLKIGHTPGQWLMRTLLESGLLHNEIYIDHGQGWKVVNFNDVLREAMTRI
jgi:hypothetical protein